MRSVQQPSSLDRILDLYDRYGILPSVTGGDDAAGGGALVDASGGQIGAQDRLGRAGLEQTYDRGLRGVAGTTTVTVDPRGAVTGLVGAAASGTALGPIAAPIIATSIAYSRPMQGLLNALYRLPDDATAQRLLREAEALARQNPALQPYYQEAYRFVTQQEPLRPQSPASRNQAPEGRLAG